MMRLLSILLLLCTTVYSQTPNPYIEEFDSFGGVGEWELVTGQPNTGSHGGELCYNVSGTYIDDTYYSFESDTLDFSAWPTVEVIMVISSNLRNGDVFSFWYYEEVGGWTGYNISGIIGTRFFTIPNTAILLSFDLNTNANGNVNGKYGHVDYLEVYSPTALPIELLDFTATVDRGIVDINWSTASQVNNNYFTIERSQDGYMWENLEEIKGAGNSTSTLTYNTKDPKPYLGTSYYRLSQTDYDGTTETFQPVAVSIDRPYIVRRYNQLGQDVGEDYKGLVIILMSDGSIKKILNFN